MGEFAKSSVGGGNAGLEHGFLTDLIAGFANNTLVARRAMRELMQQSPGKFYSAAFQLLKSGQTGPGHDHLVTLMLENDLLLAALINPDAFPVEAATALTRSLQRMDSQLDAKLLREALKGEHEEEGARPEVIERALELVDAISTTTRLVPMLMKLMRHPSERIRSKAGLLVVRAHRNPDWFSTQLESKDPRVRSNLIEGLLETEPSDREIKALWPAAQDPHHRVATTALLVLFKKGHEDAADMLEQLVTHPDDLFRAAAAWAMGQSNDLRFLPNLQVMARTDKGVAKRSALKACVNLRKNAPPANPPAEQCVIESAETG